MIDLLAEVQAGQATSSANGANGLSTISAGQQPIDSDRTSGNHPLQQDLGPQVNGRSGSKKSLFSKGRGKQPSEVNKSPTGSGSLDYSNENKTANEYSPLGSQMRSMSLGRDPAQEQVSASPSQKELTFLEKVKLYRKRRKSQGKGMGSPSMGPLEEGATGSTPLSTPRQPEPPTNAAALSANTEKENLNKFFDLVSKIKSQLVEVVREQKNVEKERQGMRLLINAEEIQEAQQAIQEKIQEVTLMCKNVKSMLDELDQMYAQSLEADDVVESDETLKLHLSVMSGLNARAAEVIKAWQNMQSSWTAQDMEEVGQKLHIVTGRNFSDQEVEEVLDNGTAEQLYRQALTENVSSAHVRKVLQDVQQRHEQFRQLEASMVELHQVFLDLSILVADQGATIDNISNWVENTAMTMQSSLIQLHQAKVSRRRAAQKKAVTFVTGVGLVAGGAGLTATGVGAVAGVPMMVAGAAAVGASGIGGMT